jgi:ABC-type Fe3+ transport system substrate-binding protein
MRGARYLQGAVCATAALLLAVGPATAQQYTAQETKLIEAAKAEGEVSVLHPILGDHSFGLLSKAFIDFYKLGPSFKLNNLRKGSGQTIAQVRQEIQANKFTVDILVVNAAGFFDEAAKRGAFLPLDSAQWQHHEELVRKAGQYSSYPHVVVPFAYTFRPIWNTSCPGMKDIKVTEYADVFDVAKLKGKTIASDLSKSVTYTNTFASLVENGIVTDTKAFWGKLKATEPIVEFRSEAKIQLVINCERPFDMWITAGRVQQNVAREPKLAEIIKIGSYKEGHVMLGNQAGVLKGAPHPNAGKLLLEFMLRKEGADALVGGESLYTFRKGYVVPEHVKPYVLDLEKTKILGLKDWVASAKKMTELREEWLGFFK